MIRSVEMEHQIRFSISGTSKFSEARKVVGKTGKSLLKKEKDCRILVRTNTAR